MQKPEDLLKQNPFKNTPEQKDELEKNDAKSISLS